MPQSLPLNMDSLTRSSTSSFFSLLSLIMPFFSFVLTHSERVSCFTCFTCRFGLVRPISKIAAECCTWGLALLCAGELHVIRTACKSCSFVIKSGCLFWKVPVWWKSNSLICEHIIYCIYYTSWLDWFGICLISAAHKSLIKGRSLLIQLWT